jgi:hypothetical protein
MKKLFKVELGMWVEIKLDFNWILGNIVDISKDGKTLHIETHEDTYKINRLTEAEIIRKVEM